MFTRFMVLCGRGVSRLAVAPWWRKWVLHSCGSSLCWAPSC